MKKIIGLWIKQNSLKQTIKDKLSNENGQGMVEYGLILALVSIVVIAALALLGDNLNLKFGEINTELTPAP